MNLRPLVPVVILAMWQATPDTVIRGTDGHLRFSYGYGASNYVRDFEWYGSDTYCSGGDGCSGNCTTGDPYLHHEQRHDSYGVRAVEVEAWPNDLWRITGALGSASGKTVGGALAAYEGRTIGVGAGFSGGADSRQPSGVAGYLRLGDLDGVHVRGELLSPGAIWGAGGMSRAGIAYNLGRVHGWGWYFGVASTLGHADVDALPSQEASVFGEVHFPLMSTISLVMRGHTGTNGGGFGMGVRAGLGR